MIVLAVAFLLTALLYASVGFGGGSTYSALLALSDVDYRIMPLLALSCNVIVVAGSTVRFARRKITPWRGAVVLTAIAAPAAFLGGLTPIDERSFLLLLGASLVLTGLTMLAPVATGPQGEQVSPGAKWMPIAAFPLGYLAGLVGIGGGIFIAPLLHLVRWNDARAIAATASFFILVNSIFGIAGQIMKAGPDRLSAAISFGLPLMLAVVIGGQIGSLLAVRFLPLAWIRWLTAALTIWVGARLLTGT
ncbi:TSUP family transporter [Altererythrobacter aurantiacus]|uniref:Probable membrane transporter protein n=1 Tax=Parapontixanthobacter aurantiacus TaxID=1463599 RepID=A0A844ZB30_9SPHN|nr:sulfite exporter TauE/SafE family protein [Parapontixanthobacter aurantiacus]MXO85125.1 TSUP family transporter [Parapontixanthobacter aurantiacus]